MHFEQGKVERILLVEATRLEADTRLENGRSQSDPEWQGGGKAGDGITTNFGISYEQRGRSLSFLPGTFFLADLVVDAQHLRQVTDDELRVHSMCAL